MTLPPPEHPWAAAGARRGLGQGGTLQPRGPPSTQRPDASSPPTCGRGCAGRSGLGRARTRAPGLLGSRSSPATSQLARAPRAGGGEGLSGHAHWAGFVRAVLPAPTQLPPSLLSHLFCSCTSLPPTSILLSSSFCPAPLLSRSAFASLYLPPPPSAWSPSFLGPARLFSLPAPSSLLTSFSLPAPLPLHLLLGLHPPSVSWPQSSTSIGLFVSLALSHLLSWGYCRSRVGVLGPPYFPRLLWPSVGIKVLPGATRLGKAATARLDWS